MRGILIEDVFQSVRAEVRSETLRQLLLQSGVALGVMAVISMGLGWVVAGRALRPLHDISATVRRISDRNLDERVALAGPRDEVRELADQFDVMLDRLQAAFEAQREFVANASHELRTPLTIMRTELDVTLAADRVSQEDVRRMAEVVRRAIDRSERLIDSLLVLATAEGPVERSDRVDLGELARASLDQRSEAIAELDLRPEVALGPAPFAGNGSLVERLVDNLVENAIEHNVHGGLLAVTTATDAGEAVLRVENDGAVIAPDEAERMFDRFARLGRSRSRASGGYGLGLSIVRAIKALTFDIGGTVFDWHSTIRDEVGRLAAERGASVDAAQFANDWRRGMFELLGQVRGGDLPWMNADELHRRALDPLAERYAALELSEVDRDELNLLWHRLRAWPDAPDAIEALRGRYTVVVLTVLSWAIAVDSSKAAGVRWDGVLSCEFLGHYKPDAEAYQAGVRLLGIEPAEAMMVAAHPGDLRAAMAAGLSSAYVPRPGERGEGNDGDLSPQPDFAVNATDFPDLAKRLLA